MSVLWILFEILVNIFQGIILSYCVYSFLGDKKSKPYLKSPGIICAALLAITITVFNYTTMYEHFFVLIYVLITFIYALICLRGSITRKIFASLFPLITIFLISTLLPNFFASFLDVTLREILAVNNINRLIVIILVQITNYYFCMISLKIFKVQNELTSGEWVLISIVLLISIAVTTLLNLISLNNLSQTDKLYVLFSISGLAFINIATFFIVVNLSKKNEAMKENELLKIENTYNRQYVKNAKIEYETIRKLKHDSEDNYSAIYTLLAEGKCEKAMKYIEDNIALFFKAESFINTDNEIANAVINSKLTTAKSFGIAVNCLSTSDFSGITDIDLCRLLSNMLDNALTSCTSAKDKSKRIYLKITCDGAGYSFNVKNSIEASVLKSNPNLETAKKDTTNHGYGIKIIRDIASKYNGRCDFYEEEDYFCCTVLLNKIKQLTE